MKEFIRAEHLSFSYESIEDAPPALYDITLSIKKGEYVAVLGHNGSGKSTFAKLLNMILIPTSGKLYVDGMELTCPDFTEEQLFALRRKIGMVFQNPDNQLVAGVVEEDVAFGLENLGVPYAEMHKRVKEALSLVGMTEYALHAPSRLSGGQKQRVAIAGVLAMLPSCMILDEATAMLDPQGRIEVLETVEKLHREQGLTLLHITHYMDEAARAGRIVVIHDGRVWADGTPSEVFARRDELRAIGLDVPGETEIVEDLRKDGFSLPAGCIGTEVCADEIAKALGTL
ncbi:MAG: energy-coupling factor transporter ATPase [Clostridia bacterium]|nr:energy-coupling factor transporter ATPase [Clostridia bacterium]